ncbi:hypothetical protein [Brevibacillus sp. SYP-B805]|uniref:hypothetical protein n=1 Tax=Brevibacillus sp. SYP-B805 TaxID=1578199 RepID=UPI0013EABDC1|nr:hypothetical protein [Brevibacillus sp. SYP-B805]
MTKQLPGGSFCPIGVDYSSMGAAETLPGDRFAIWGLTFNGYQFRMILIIFPLHKKIHRLKNNNNHYQLKLLLPAGNSNRRF